VQAAGADVLRAVVHHLRDARQLQDPLSSNASSTPSVARRAAYCRVIAFWAG